jgi:hypothetical protein
MKAAPQIVSPGRAGAGVIHPKPTTRMATAISTRDALWIRPNPNRATTPPAHLRNLLRILPVEDNRHASVRERVGSSGADALGRAGDTGGLSTEINLHSSSLFMTVSATARAIARFPSAPGCR